MSLSEVAVASGLPRPTARRILITLEQLGYVRSGDEGFVLTPRVIELGMAYIGSTSIWDIVRPNLADLVKQTNESSSVAQLDGSDVVYVARVAVPKLVTLSVTIGTRFPAVSTSLGKVLLAALTPEELDRTLAEPTRSGLVPRWQPSRSEIDAALEEVRERGWAITDEQLAQGHPLRGDRGARRRRPHCGGRQRQLQQRRDLDRDAHRAPPAAAPEVRGGHRTRLGRVAFAPTPGRLLDLRASPRNANSGRAARVSDHNWYPGAQCATG